MKHNYTNRILRTLKASTRVRLHPEFVKEPTSFARRHGVDLVGEVFPATSFTTNKETSEKDGKVKANIHLVQHKAIRLFTERDSDGDWIRGYDLRPFILLNDTKDRPLTGGDLTTALSTLRDQVTQLLADPLDARHIVPGMVADDTDVAYWREIESEVLIPDVDLPCLHDASHPDTGPAEGSTKKRIKLGDRGDCVILIEPAMWTVSGPDGSREVHGVGVRLRLRGNALLSSLRESGKTSLVGDIMRLVSFRAPDVGRAHQDYMSQLEGFYLPVPPQWSEMGKPMTTAKVIALLSKLTPILPEELRAMYEAQSNPSKSTRKRLNKDARAAAACLQHIPVSSLFRPEVYAAQTAQSSRPPHVHIDPQIAAAYGSNSTSH
jgi:hypothetical protein